MHFKTKEDKCLDKSFAAGLNRWMSRTFSVRSKQTFASSRSRHMVSESAALVSNDSACKAVWWVAGVVSQQQGGLATVVSLSSRNWFHNSVITSVSTISVVETVLLVFNGNGNSV
jgi:hypothetical protein